MNIEVLGAATTQFGELWGTSSFDLAKEAISKALIDASLKASQIDALFIGNMLSGTLDNQANLGSYYASALGNFVPSFRVEAACASGGLAIHNAINSILAGAYSTVVVLGIEKMTDVSSEDATAGLMAAGSVEERLSGITFPGIYALMAREYMDMYHRTEEDLAYISVKNHYHGTLNSNAQFRYAITPQDVLNSSKIADPLKLLDCSPVSDGAAAIVLSASSRDKKGSVSIVASEIGTDSLGLTERTSLTSLPAVVRASQKAYASASISADDIDVCEIHDCFSIAEAIATEDLGFSKRGQACVDVSKGFLSLSGMPSVKHETRQLKPQKAKVVTNPSGGLKSCGHPVGATGVKQVVEITNQLRGTCGQRQVDGARIGLTHNVGGSGAIAAIHILTKQL